MSNSSPRPARSKNSTGVTVALAIELLVGAALTGLAARLYVTGAPTEAKLFLTTVAAFCWMAAIGTGLLLLWLIRH